jgi:chemotaxis protein CheZ
VRGVRRQVFRVEQMFVGRRSAAAPNAAGGHNAADRPKALRALAAGNLDAEALRRELAIVQEAIARNRRDLAALIGDSKDRRMPRAAGELGAAVAAMEQATQKILQAAETIDDGARSLNAALKGDYERGLAHEIQERTVAIYEACNFQDLAGQRIGKVIEMLHHIEEQLSAMLARLHGPAAEPAPTPAGNELLNGPRLDGDCGHADQRDIDALFG